jgi:hypothetical protein
LHYTQIILTPLTNRYAKDCNGLKEREIDLCNTDRTWAAQSIGNINVHCVC